MKALFTLFLAVGLLLPNFSVAQHYDSDRSFLGVESDEISREKARKLGLDNPHGVMVSRVVAGSAADEAGLQPFDYIYRFDNSEFSADKGFTAHLRDYRAGDKTTLHYVRKGKNRTVNVTFGSPADSSHDYTDQARDGEKPFLGVSHVATVDRGVKVNITDGSTAEKAGMKDGDILMYLNDYRITDWTDIKNAMRTTGTGENAVLVYLQNGEERRGKTEMGARDYDRREYSYSHGGDSRFERSMERLGESFERMGERIEEDAEGWAERFGEKMERWGENLEEDLEDFFEGDSNVKVYGDGAFLGIGSRSVSRDKADFLDFDNPYGKYVKTIYEGSAAEKAGLRVFDYVYGIDTYRTGREQSLNDIIDKYEVGDKAEVLFIRDGKKMTAPITFGERSFSSGRNECDEPFLGVSSMHSSQGKVIVRVVDNSAADDMGLQTNDRILAINDRLIYDWTDLTTAIDNAEPGAEMKVDIRRDGDKMTKRGVVNAKRDSRDCDDDRNVTIFRDNDDNDDPDRDRDRDADVRLNRSPEAVDVSDMEAKTENVSADEVDKMREEYGVDMPRESNLAVSSTEVFPNPSMGMFTVKFNLPERGDTAVRIYNSLGREIYSYDLSDFTGAFQDNIDLSQNGTGSYFLAVSQNGKTMTKKIVLQRR